MSRPELEPVADASRTETPSGPELPTPASGERPASAGGPESGLAPAHRDRPGLSEDPSPIQMASAGAADGLANGAGVHTPQPASPPTGRETPAPGDGIPRGAVDSSPVLPGVAQPAPGTQPTAPAGPRPADSPVPEAVQPAPVLDPASALGADADRVETWLRSTGRLRPAAEGPR
jgi:hypothetical protein